MLDFAGLEMEVIAMQSSTQSERPDHGGILTLDSIDETMRFGASFIPADMRDCTFESLT